MTSPDHDPVPDEPLDDDALAVHAVVEDDATAEQRRRVARDPDLVAQVAAIRRAVGAVAAPVDPPGDDVLAALRQRAIAALDEPSEPAEPAEPAASSAADEPVEAAPVAAPAPPPPPIRDLGEARTRRRRSLPPLPAVAAVVVLLVLVGVGLIATSGSDDEDRADTTSAADVTTGGDEGGSAGSDAEGSADDAGAGESAASEARPSDESVAQLLARTTVRYDDEEALLADLRQVDPEQLPLPAGGEAPSTTTGPSSGDATTTAPSTADEGAEPATALASDPIVTRCDDVLRAAERDVEPATAAALVDVDGIPVLVLSNPVEESEDAPSGVRLTVLNALDCSPRAAVLR